MYVSEVMTHCVESITPDATIQEAARRMVALEIGPLPVCENDHLVGIVTDRDITARAVARGIDARSPVRDVMTPEVVYCFDDQDLVEAGQLMQDHQIRRLVVLSRDRKLVGMLSLADLARESDDRRIPQQTLKAVSTPSGEPVKANVEMPGKDVAKPLAENPVGCEGVA